MTGHLEQATQAIGLARAQALLRGDLHAAHRLERLHVIVSNEAEYVDNIRLGLCMVPLPLSDEWLPGRPDDETIAELASDDAHHRQLARINELVA